ncbi:1,4-alpha-glucan branching protein GlgB [Pseudoalteromonas sp. CO325X]|nr:1,4-alpha-glucan branching protein GlgB [Pseudoalteromonas sp. CO325X]
MIDNTPLPDLADAVCALEEAQVGEPRQLLGHQRIDGSWYVILYKPGALAVEVQFATHTCIAQRYSDSEVFIAPAPAEFVPYQLCVTYPEAVVVQADPFCLPLGLSAADLYYFRQGTEQQAQRHLGAHMMTLQGHRGVRFSVWAPNALAVSVTGDFNHWDSRQHPMARVEDSGVWAIFIPDVAPGQCYKYHIRTLSGEALLKADPYAFATELPPNTASRVSAVTLPKALDEQSYEQRERRNAIDAAISIYELHIGSWRRTADNQFLNYRELAAQLIPYVEEMGFTHIQLMPVSEFPFDGSWGYQSTGLFAPTSRFGSGDDFAYFCAQCRAHNIGVLIDWVPGHFPADAHGLGRFDGTHLYEHADHRQGYHPDWHTYIYNYERQEVRSFLTSSASFWLEQYGVDGLRVDAVASMLYLDYSREHGQWLANHLGGRENLGAIACLQQINSVCYGRNRGIMMVAEESTAWPGVTQTTDSGGLGFGFKWNMGWMNDSLRYMQLDPIYRQYHHHDMTFSMVYAYSENYILPLSHDEVVHGKGSLLSKMPGDSWQQHANLRAYLGFMWAHPGKKLLFMGGEFAQQREWDHNHALDWHLLDDPAHQGMQRWVKCLNQLYRSYPALHENDCDERGFRWLDGNNSQQSIYSFVRIASSLPQVVLAVVNMTPQVHHDFRIGVPHAGSYRVIANSDESQYSGSGVRVCAERPANEQPSPSEPLPSEPLYSEPLLSEPLPWHGQSQSISICVPPLACVYLLWEAPDHE